MNKKTPEAVSGAEIKNIKEAKDSLQHIKTELKKLGQKGTLMLEELNFLKRLFADLQGLGKKSRETEEYQTALDKYQRVFALLQEMKAIIINHTGRVDEKLKEKLAEKKREVEEILKDSKSEIPKQEDFSDILPGAGEFDETMSDLPPAVEETDKAVASADTESEAKEDAPDHTTEPDVEQPVVEAQTTEKREPAEPDRIKLLDWQKVGDKHFYLGQVVHYQNGGKGFITSLDSSLGIIEVNGDVDSHDVIFVADLADKLDFNQISQPGIGEMTTEEKAMFNDRIDEAQQRLDEASKGKDKKFRKMARAISFEDALADYKSLLKEYFERNQDEHANYKEFLQIFEQNLASRLKDDKVVREIMQNTQADFARSQDYMQRKQAKAKAAAEADKTKTTAKLQPESETITPKTNETLPKPPELEVKERQDENETKTVAEITAPAIEEEIEEEPEWESSDENERIIKEEEEKPADADVDADVREKERRPSWLKRQKKKLIAISAALGIAGGGVAVQQAYENKDREEESEVVTEKQRGAELTKEAQEYIRVLQEAQSAIQDRLADLRQRSSARARALIDEVNTFLPAEIARVEQGGELSVETFHKIRSNGKYDLAEMAKDIWSKLSPEQKLILVGDKAGILGKAKSGADKVWIAQNGSHLLLLEQAGEQGFDYQPNYTFFVNENNELKMSDKIGKSYEINFLPDFLNQLAGK